jgi:hypothetical protein
MGLCASLEALPSIEVTHVPIYGTDENLRGRVRLRDVKLPPPYETTYHVAAYLFLEGVGWYVKPELALPCTSVSPSGEFEVDVTTGGSDTIAHRYAVFLLPFAAPCPTAFADPFLPMPLAGYAHDIVDRNPFTTRFSGYTWVRRDSPYPSGPAQDADPARNCFSPDNAFVDTLGNLRLRMAIAECQGIDRGPRPHDRSH